MLSLSTSACLIASLMLAMGFSGCVEDSPQPNSEGIYPYLINPTNRTIGLGISIPSELPPPAMLQENKAEIETLESILLNHAEEIHGGCTSPGQSDDAFAKPHLIILKALIRMCGSEARMQLRNSDIPVDERATELERARAAATMAYEEATTTAASIQPASIVEIEVIGFAQEQLIGLSFVLQNSMKLINTSSESDWLARMFEAATVEQDSTAWTRFLGLISQEDFECALSSAPWQTMTTELRDDVAKRTYALGVSDEEWWSTIDQTVVQVVDEALERNWTPAVIFAYQGLLRYDGYLESYASPTLPNPREGAFLVAKAQSERRSLLHDYHAHEIIQGLQAAQYSKELIDPLIEAIAFDKMPWALNSYACGQVTKSN